MYIVKPNASVDMATLEAAQRDYDANIASIPWNNSVKRAADQEKDRYNSIIDTNLPIYVNLVEQEARGISGAAQQRARALEALNTPYINFKQLPLQLDDRISKIDIGSIQNKINLVEEQIIAEKAKQNKSNELLELRKNQAAALENKYSANIHSSWLGLWRPLKDNTHVGLNVASVMFGILGFLTICYLGYVYYSAPAAGGGGPMPEVARAANKLMNNLMGGFRKVKRNNN